MNRGTLYVVATPIGNLEDITVRAINVLQRVELCACEDTRRSGILFRRWAISTPVTSLHRFSEAAKTGLVLGCLEQGKDVALLSDAGTPGISDPGSRLVRAVLDAGFRVTPIPGPSSITAALSASGMDGSSFAFLGFVPRKVDQKKAFFERLRLEDRTALFLETPLRVKATLQVASRILGSRRMVLWREITKIHEETLSGAAEAILAELETRPSVKGEIIILVEGLTRLEPTMDVAEAVSILMAEGFTGKRLADEAHKRFGVKKGNAYATFLAMRADR